MRILLTGASGGIGKKLINDLLQSQKYKIRLLVRNKTNIKNIINEVELIEGDLLDLNSLEKATTGVQTVLHLAGLTHSHIPDSYYTINTSGTENLLKASELNSVNKFVFISSRTASESGGAYARSKLLAEERVKQFKRSWVILKIAEVYGANDKEAINKLIHIIKKSYFIPIIGDGEYKLAPVYVNDVVWAILRVIERDTIINEEYIIAGPVQYSYNEIVDIISNKMGLKRKKIFLPIFIIRLLAFFCRILRSNLIVEDQISRLMSPKSIDISRARDNFNFTPQDFQSRLDEILNMR